MKKKLLFIMMFVFAINMNAQFTLEDGEGNLIADGTVLPFNVITYPEASWDFYVNNTSTTDNIKMKILFESAMNADGSMLELCFGLCYTGISVGQTFPTGNDWVEILPGEQTLPGNHIFNSDPGNGTDIIEYVFRYFQIDDSGAEIGTPITVTYKFDPLLGTEDFNELDVNISSTIIENEMIVHSIEELDVAIFDLQGRLVKNQKINTGQQVVNMSELASQLYVVKFKNKEGASKTIKVLVK